MTYISHTSGLEQPANPILDNVSDFWMRLKLITMADKARRIGERVIDGVPTVGFGFEISAREISADTNIAVGQVRGQIWVHRDDGVPLLIEIEFQNALGQKTHQETSNIRWNVPLDESLFDLSVPKDWNLSRTRIETAEYSGVGLAPGVTLEISQAGQEPLAAAGDVDRVVRAAQTTHPDSNISEVQITIDLKPDAAQRLHDYADAHPDKLIIVDFNGQINVAGRLVAANPTQMNLDLSLLGLPLAELEETYFTTSIERSEQ